MASPLQTVAKCIARWLYEQASAILQQLKAFILALIDLIDQQILILRAILASMDILAQLEQAAWNRIEDAFNAIRDALFQSVDGPAGNECPEFYQDIMEPAISMFENSVTALTVFRERHKNMLSYMDEVDEAISYWEAVKVQLVAILNVLDDALYAALMREAERVP